MAPSITWEHLPDSGAPQVGVTVSGVAGTQPVTVEVSWDGGVSWHGVRGARQVPVTDTAFFRDFVPPLNASIAYRVTCSDGAQAVSPSGTVTSDTAWMQDPLDPRGAIPVATSMDGPDRVRLMSGTAAEVSRSQPVDLVTVQGASAPVASVGTRQAPAGVPLILRPLLDLAADQGALVNALRELIDTAGQVVLRGLPDALGLDPVAHYVAPGVIERPSLGGVLGYREWQMSLTQVRPQSLRIVVPWWTYGDVQQIVQSALTDAAYADVLAALPAGTRYLDALRDPHVLIGG